MGFASMREMFSLLDRVHAELKVGRGEVEWIGYGGTARRSVGDLRLASACGVELRLSLGAWGGAEGRWVSDPCALSSLSLSLCESWKLFKGKMRVQLILRLKWVLFTVNGNVFPFDQIFHAQPNTWQGVK